MRRGELYRVSKPGAGDPRAFRVFVVVSRLVLIESKYANVVCAPVYSARHGLATEVEVGVDEGLKHESAVQCDGLVSLPKALLTHYVGRLSAGQLLALDRALVSALAIDVESIRSQLRSSDFSG